MKKIIYVFMFMALLFVVNACRDDSQMFSNEDNGLELVKANEKVINLIKDFSLMANNGNVISKATSNFVVNSITKKTITCFIEAAKARSTESTSVDIYSVEFTKDGQKGFSIATDDDRLNRIFAYSENGELGDTIFNDGLKMFVNGIPYYCEDELQEYYVSQSKAARSLVVETVPNFIPTQWSQGTPYNNDCPSCSTNSSGHTLLGCGPVAVAQALAYYGKKNLTTKFWSYSDFADQTHIYSGSIAATKVAPFTYDVARLCGANFGCDATSVKFKNCRNALDKYGISYAYHDGNLKQSGTWNTLVKKNVVIACGSTGSVGHAWLYTGAMAYVDSSSRVVDNIIALYANWGWGGTDDGWYYNGNWERPTSGGNYYKNNEQINISIFK